MAVDNAAEVLRIPYFKVFDITMVEFLNILSYISYKNKKLKEQIEKK